MHTLFIHPRAQHAGIVVIPLERRLGTRFLSLPLGRLLQIHGSHARSDHGAKLIEDFAYDAATTPHLVNFRLRLAHDSHVLLALRRSRGPAVNVLYNASRYVIHRLVAINGHDPAKLLIVLRHWLGLALIRIQTLAYDFLAVIIADEQPGAIYITDFVNKRR